LRLALGPTDSWTTSVAKKPLPFRRPEFSSGFAATYTKIFITNRSTRPHGRASTQSVRLPTQPPDSLWGAPISVNNLVPIIYDARILDGSAVTRCLKGWPLLSRPSRCLRIQTTCLNTQLLLRDLNWSRGLPPLGARACLGQPNSGLLRPCLLRSLTIRRGCYSPYPIIGGSTRHVPPAGLYYSTLRQEPAIAKLE
jgi:hypothetical protein